MRLFNVGFIRFKGTAIGIRTAECMVCSDGNAVSGAGFSFSVIHAIAHIAFYNWRMMRMVIWSVSIIHVLSLLVYNEFAYIVSTIKEITQRK